MSLVKRLCSLLIILLLLISMYKDLTKNTPLKSIENYRRVNETNIETHNFLVIKVKVKHGDTLLSITEKLNEQHVSEINMPIIIEDFKSLNNYADPYNLLEDTFYLFPLYNRH